MRPEIARASALWFCICLMAALLSPPQPVHAADPAANAVIHIGLASYLDVTPSARADRETSIPLAIYRTGAAAAQAAPTNQWYSSVMFGRWSYPIYAQPMTYRAGSRGFEVGLPDRRARSPDLYQREIRYPHRAAITVGSMGFAPHDARLKNFSDWSAQFSLAAANGKSLDVTVLHGSPFAYFECSAGDIRFALHGHPVILVDPRRHGADPRVIVLGIEGHTYALFAPTAARWEWHSAAQEVVLRLPVSARYFSVAGLPDSKPSTVASFLAVAYAFPTDTRVEWKYDERTSSIRTSFHVTTVAREGSNLTTLMGLYPHQWSALNPQPASLYEYETVRGTLRMIRGNEFATELTYHGIVPLWGGLESTEHRAALAPLSADTDHVAELFAQQPGDGTYWYGKGVGAVAQLLSVAEAQDEQPDGELLLAELKRRLESWFDGSHAGHFAQDPQLGTFIGLPEEYYSVSHMNDHHFHYGYWLMGAAHVALRDPTWASEDHWGGIVGKLIADIATDQRGRRDFPFLRNFDPYEGHSWAAGDSTWLAIARYGNNEESSSEAVNAWAALILWEATGNRRLRDLGIYLYTSEVSAIEQYWFDVNHQVLGSDFGKPFATQVFGGKFAYNTWWTAEPHEVYGINLLPLTPASVYLGADPASVRAAFANLPAEEQHYRRQGREESPENQNEIWQDALASYLALTDPAAGLARWNPAGSVESGETRSHTLYWLLSLSEMGTPDLGITADTALYSVFHDAQGQRTYLAYNAGDTARQVLFSDGKRLDVNPHALARTH